VVLGVEEELNGVTDISSDVARAVYQLTAWANLNRMGRGGTGGGGTGTGGGGGGTRSVSGVGRFRCRSVLSTICR